MPADSTFRGDNPADAGHRIHSSGIHTTATTHHLVARSIGRRHTECASTGLIPVTFGHQANSFNPARDVPTSDCRRKSQEVACSSTECVARMEQMGERVDDVQPAHASCHVVALMNVGFMSQSLDSSQ